MSDQTLYSIKGTGSGPRGGGLDQAIKDIAFMNDVEVEIERETSWLREHVRYTVTGTKEKLGDFRKDFIATIEAHNKRIST